MGGPLISDDIKQQVGNNARVTFRGHIDPAGKFKVDGRVN
jgi:hypothetical protein